MSRPKCPTPCRRASTPITAGAAAPGAQPCGPGSWAIAPPMPLLAPVTRTRQRWSCMNRWYPGAGAAAGCARTNSGAGCRPVVNRAEPAAFGRQCGREPWALSRAHGKTRNARGMHAVAPPSTRTLAPASANWPRRSTGARCRCTVQETIRAADRTEQVLLSYPARSSLPTRLGPPSAAGPRGGRPRWVGEPTRQRQRAREDAATRR